jgi:hypothetical protein
VADTSILGSSDAVLGESLILGEGSISGFNPYQSASSTLALSQSFSYIGPHPASATSVLALTSRGRIAQTYNLLVTSTLSFSQSAARRGGRYAASSTLNLVSSADTREKQREAEHTLAFTQQAVGSLVKVARSQINFTQSAVNGLINLEAVTQISFTQRARVPLSASASNTLAFSQLPRSSIVGVYPTSTIAFSDSNRVGRPWRVSAESQMRQSTVIGYDPVTYEPIYETTGLSQSVDVRRLQAYPLRQYMQLSQRVVGVLVKAGAIGRSASSTISFTQRAPWTATPDAVTNLALTQAAVGHRSRLAVSTLNLSQSVSEVLIKLQGLTSSLLLSQSLAFLLEKSSTYCDYSPFVGASSDPDAPTPPPGSLPSLPGLPAGVRFRLQCPVDSPTDIVDLRAPNFGNRDRFQFTRINRETRGGTLIVYADPIWPKVETLAFQFSTLKDTEAEDLLTFMRTRIGQRVAIYDHEGRKWAGVITTPNEAVVHDGRRGFTASFEFEGEVV